MLLIYRVFNISFMFSLIWEECLWSLLNNIHKLTMEKGREGFLYFDLSKIYFTASVWGVEKEQDHNTFLVLSIIHYSLVLPVYSLFNQNVPGNGFHNYHLMECHLTLNVPYRIGAYFIKIYLSFSGIISPVGFWFFF